MQEYMKGRYKHINLPLVAHAQLKTLSERYSMTMTQILTKLIDDEYKS